VLSLGATPIQIGATDKGTDDVFMSHIESLVALYRHAALLEIEQEFDGRERKHDVSAIARHPHSIVQSDCEALNESQASRLDPEMPSTRST
jgi:hypothetical protein